MKLLDLTLPTPTENVALDEALLDAAEAGEVADKVLRFWESPRAVVVLGRSSRVAEEVDLDACRNAGVPVLRRPSGGAAIVTGPGCLMYAVVLSYRGREHLRLLDEAHRHVASEMITAISTLGARAQHVGTSDLAIHGRKFSGNSLRCKRSHFLYHGTLLCDFDLSLIERLLKMPPRQPDYRLGRPHRDFVTNLGIPANDLRRAIAAAFAAHQPLSDWPRQRTAELLASRYSRDEWNFNR